MDTSVVDMFQMVANFITPPAIAVGGWLISRFTNRFDKFAEIIGELNTTVAVLKTEQTNIKVDLDGRLGKVEEELTGLAEDISSIRTKVALIQQELDTMPPKD